MPNGARVQGHFQIEYKFKLSAITDAQLRNCNMTNNFDSTA